MNRLWIVLCIGLLFVGAAWAQADVEGPEILTRELAGSLIDDGSDSLGFRHDHDDGDGDHHNGDPGEDCEDGPYCGDPHETEPNWPCAEHIDPFVIECGSTFYGRHCTESDKDYIQVLVPAWTKMKLKFWDSSCESNPTEHTRFEIYPGDEDSPNGCGNDTQVYYRNYVWLWNNSCEPWHLLVEAQGRSDSDDNDPTRYKIVATECVELPDNPCTTVPCEAPNPRLVEFTGQLPICECVQICEAEVLTLCVGPLEARHLPLEWTFTPGCSPNGGAACTEDCDAAFPTAISNWEYNADSHTWCIDLISSTSGCFCFCLDDILPIELLDFTAVSRSSEVELRWNTASETSVNYFDLLRNGEIVQRVESAGDVNGGHYSWLDNEVENGMTYEYKLVAVDESGNREDLGTVTGAPNFSAGTLTSYALHQNYPNPFNPTTTIAFDLPVGGLVSLKVYNPIGQLVSTLVNDVQSEGRHMVTFDATNLPSGLYFYRLTAGSFSTQQKMLLIK